jgi:GNAT superfamily N-acetyltransferase
MDAHEYRFNEYVVSTDRARHDLEVIHHFLTHSYWAKGIPREIVARSIQNSLCFGVFKCNQQVGFARVVSDFSTYAYLGDVFILPEHRGRGLAKFLMRCIVEHPRLQGLRRWSLATRDAHSLYAEFGFRALADPESHMEIYNREVYQKPKPEFSQ